MFVSVSACYMVRTLANCHLNYRHNDGGGPLFSGHFVYFPPDNVVFVASACPGRSDVVVLWSQSASPGPLSSLLSHTMIIVTTRSQLIDKLVIRPSFVMHSRALGQQSACDL